MSNFSSKDLAAMAAGMAAGILTQDAVMETLGNDQSLMDEVLGLVAGVSVGGIVEDTVQTVVDAPIISDVFDVVDDIFDW
jgi:hypothetical protein